jgi:ligand-binding SRPBCC domain-containing protein
MHLYTLHREQWLPRPAEEVFAFFSYPQNLEAITPPWLGFRILTPPPIAMGRGARIEYRLKVHGIGLGWLTGIEAWEPPVSFTCVQVRGPYRVWRHMHRFVPERGGVSVEDTVVYALPCGLAGRVVHFLKVRRDLERIFDYRRERIAERFSAVVENG